VDVAEETDIGTGVYHNMEVVQQTILSDTSTTKVSDDLRRLVFRDCTKFDGFNPIGLKYVFPYNHDLSIDESQQQVWLTVNRSAMQTTSSVVVYRCNNTLGTEFYNSQGSVKQYHYEPVVFDANMSAVGWNLSDTAITEESKLACIVQYNKFTSQYYVNQRFVLGDNAVYQVTSINRSHSNMTFQPTVIGIIILYMVSVAKDPKDDFVNRIAYNQGEQTVVSQDPQTDSAHIAFTSPAAADWPLNLTSAPITFDAQPMLGDSSVSAAITVEASIAGCADPESYFSMTQSGNSFTLTRLDRYMAAPLTVTVSATVEGTPASYSFTLGLAAME
jgi:hypothetical protein